MSVPTEGFYTKLAGIAAVLGVIIAFLAWRYPHTQPLVDAAPESSEYSPPAPPGGAPETSEAPARPPEKVSPPSPRDIPPNRPPQAEAPSEFTLRDGEQKVLLSGQASVGVQFSQIGEERFLTLHINVGNEETSHAVLAPGARFPLRIQGAQYYISLLRLDLSGMTARIRIDRTQ